MSLKFDYKFIKKWANIELSHVYDTFLIERVLNCGRKNIKFGLDALVERYCSETTKKILIGSSNPKICDLII